jgi:hypothetical protein
VCVCVCVCVCVSVCLSVCLSWGGVGVPRAPPLSYLVLIKLNKAGTKKQVSPLELCLVTNPSLSVGHCSLIAPALPGACPSLPVRTIAGMHIQALPATTYPQLHEPHM